MMKIGLNCPFLNLQQDQFGGLDSRQKYQLRRDKIESLKLLKSRLQLLGISSKIPNKERKESSIVDRTELDIISDAFTFRPEIFNINSKVRDRDKSNKENMLLLSLLKRMKKRKINKNYFANANRYKSKDWMFEKKTVPQNKAVKTTSFIKEKKLQYSCMNVSREASNYDMNTVTKINNNNTSINGSLTTAPEVNYNNINGMNDPKVLKAIIYSNFPNNKSLSSLHKSKLFNNKTKSLFDSFEEINEINRKEIYKSISQNKIPLPSCLKKPQINNTNKSQANLINSNRNHSPRNKDIILSLPPSFKDPINHLGKHPKNHHKLLKPIRIVMN